MDLILYHNYYEQVLNTVLDEFGVIPYPVYQALLRKQREYFKKHLPKNSVKNKKLIVLVYFDKNCKTQIEVFSDVMAANERLESLNKRKEIVDKRQKYSKVFSMTAYEILTEIGYVANNHIKEYLLFYNIPMVEEIKVESKQIIEFYFDEQVVDLYQYEDNENSRTILSDTLNNMRKRGTNVSYRIREFQHGSLLKEFDEDTLENLVFLNNKLIAYNFVRWGRSLIAHTKSKSPAKVYLLAYDELFFVEDNGNVKYKRSLSDMDYILEGVDYDD